MTSFTYAVALQNINIYGSFTEFTLFLTGNTLSGF